ncbi:MAG: hypothetical protein MK101_10000 [Phycisphaerales bacterium]|nr:hypothetical protein [Phycisphaerales bacterium]
MSCVPHILCPLAFEAAALGHLRRLGVEVICSGPGPERVQAALSPIEPTCPVILAGLATALQPHVPGGSAWWIDAVHQVDAPPPLRPPAGASTASVCQVRDVLPDRPCREAVARATGATLADLESEAFAKAAHRDQRPWAIVRGVSDGLDATLPPVEQWVDAQGRTRLASAMGWLALHPMQVGRLLALKRDANSAMQALGTLLEALLEGPPEPC